MCPNLFKFTVKSILLITYNFNIMKTIFSILPLALVVLLSSCSSTQDLSYKDDIYSEEESYMPTTSLTSEFDEYYS